MKSKSGLRQTISSLGVFVFSSALILASACSSARKKTPELSEMLGKKVALIEVDGEATARSVIEVALVNQLVKRGSFELLPKEDVNAARATPEQNPLDSLGIARKAGADYALTARVLEFSAEQKEGYSSEEVYDSELAAERGEKEGKTQRLYKVKALSGKVSVELQFAPTDAARPDTRTGVAHAEKTVTVESKTEVAHLPPRLRFLEELSNEAFKKFFDENQ